MMELPKRDPAAAAVRKEIAIRRAGVGRTCHCGETRPEAFDPNKQCAACNREKRGMKTMDDHHIAAKANSPITLGVPVNDHRAELTVAQLDWAKEIRDNPDASPLLSGAAHILGFIDTNIYLIKALLLWVAEMLRVLDGYLVMTLGPKWWETTDLNQFAPKHDPEKKTKSQQKASSKENSSEKR